jgi:hypothetical protein
MRKKLAWYGVVVVLVAFSASTLASARSAVAADTDRSVKVTNSSSQGTLTLQRLLQSRLEWTRRLARALRFLELPPASPVNGTHTIIDEPDPAGREGEPPPEEGEPGEDNPLTAMEVDDGPGGPQAD